MDAGVILTPEESGEVVEISLNIIEEKLEKLFEADKTKRISQMDLAVLLSEDEGIKRFRGGKLGISSIRQRLTILRNSPTRRASRFFSGKEPQGEQWRFVSR